MRRLKEEEEKLKLLSNGHNRSLLRRQLGAQCVACAGTQILLACFNQPSVKVTSVSHLPMRRMYRHTESACLL